MNSNTEFNLNATNLVKMVWEKRLIIVYIAIFAFAVSLIVSFLITPMYKSVAILYPPVENQSSKEVINTTFQRGLTVFGDRNEAEQLLQILSSQTLRDIVIKKQNLIKHWELNPEGKYVRSEAYGIFISDIAFRPTKYNSVEITVYDKDPEKAAEVANEIVHVSDSLMRSIKADMALKALAVLEEQYKLANEDVNSIGDSLDLVMRAGAIHLEAQTKEIYRALARAIENNNVSAEKRLRVLYDDLARLGLPLTNLTNNYYMGLNNLKDLRNFMRVLKIEAKQGIPSQFVVDKAIPSDKKAYPKKALIVIMSTLSAIFFSIFAIIVFDFFKKIIVPNVPE